MKKIAIYGTGSAAQDLYHSVQGKENCQFFIDEFYTNQLLGCDVYKLLDIAKEELMTLDKIYICIQDNNHAMNARKRLLEQDFFLDRIKYHHSQCLASFTLPYLFNGNNEKVNDALLDLSQFDLQGWFSLENQKALIKIIQKINKKNIRILEIGSWKGLSSSLIAKTIQKQQGALYCIDPFTGASDVEKQVSEVENHSILNIFINNMKYFKLLDNIKILKMTSSDAAEILSNDSFDMIFIDGLHNYKYINKDIIDFLPKLKPGGIICGDDCEDYYTNLPKDYIDKNQHNDFSLPENGVKQSINKGYHCGVIKALHNNFNDDYNIEPGSSFWWKEND